MSLGIAVSDIVSQSDDSILATHTTWERIELGKIATIQNGFPFKSELFSPTPDGMPLIRIRDVGEDASDTFYRGEYPSEFVVNAGDLLVGMDGDFKSAIWNGPASLLNQRVCRIQLNTELFDFKFLFFSLPGYLKAIHKVTSAVTVKHLSSRSISEIPLPLPPLPEQRRIVAKLEELFSRLDAGVAAVRRSQALLKRYRQSVLHAAVTGELTRAWREAHPAPTETGEALLTRIRAERRAQWEAAQVTKRGG
ncbi:restriction endonuclease subunit S [Hymenobacter lapidarius]|uniref:restriction endonuclease subunit S n=1 Tax=Hymenobacter lapidarius TaxID=1908237 RepID=UPI0009F476B4|nr:restriction endonuclease subunit S [Hymenobacter lapidarius]